MAYVEAAVFCAFPILVARLLLCSLPIKPTGLTGHGRGGYQVGSALQAIAVLSAISHILDGTSPSEPAVAIGGCGLFFICKRRSAMQRRLVFEGCKMRSPCGAGPVHCAPHPCTLRA